MQPIKVDANLPNEKQRVILCMCTARLGGKVAVDGFAGCGGNIVALARAGCSHVVAVDICQPRLDLTRHNAAVYGVEDRVHTICNDFFIVAPTLDVRLTPRLPGMTCAWC